MKTLSIGITTFRNSLPEVKKQINDIRSYDGGHKPLINKKIFEAKNKDNWENMTQYPYEMFIQDNKHNIGKFDELK